MGTIRAATVLAAAISIACGGREAANIEGEGTDATPVDAGISESSDATAPIYPDGMLMNDGAVPLSVDGGGASTVDGTTVDLDGDSPDSDPTAFSTGVATCPSDMMVGACSPLPSYIVPPPTYQGIGDLPPMPVGSWVGCQYIACSPDHKCTSCKCMLSGGDAAWTCY